MCVEWCGAEALPGDLRSHKGELARVTVKALVACDERAWAAAASAACGTAVALHGKPNLPPRYSHSKDVLGCTPMRTDLWVTQIP